MIIDKTRIYHNNEFIRSENAIIFKDYLESGRYFKPGMHFTLISPSGCKADRKQFWVGDCTEYHQPSDSDAEIGWDYDDEFMDYPISEIRNFGFNDNLPRGL